MGVTGTNSTDPTGVTPGPAQSNDAADVAALEKALGVDVATLARVITGSVDVTKAVRGGLAEHMLADTLASQDRVHAVLRPEGRGHADRAVTLDDGTRLRVECKVVDTTTYADGTPKLDLRRSSPKDSERLYRSDAFEVVAACLHSLTGQWEFRFKATPCLERKQVTGPNGDVVERLDPNCRVDATWRATLAEAVRDADDGGAGQRWLPESDSEGQMQLDGISEPDGWSTETLI